MIQGYTAYKFAANGFVLIIDTEYPDEGILHPSLIKGKDGFRAYHDRLPHIVIVKAWEVVNSQKQRIYELERELEEANNA